MSYVPGVNSVIGYGAQTGVGEGVGSPSDFLIPEPTLTTSGYKTLFVHLNSSTTAASFWGFKDLSSNSQYQVPSGKSFYQITMFSVTNVNSFLGFQIVTSTAAIAADNTTTVPTGAIYSSGATSNYGFPFGMSTTNIINPQKFSFPVKYAQNLYLSIQVPAGASFGGVYIIGKEV